METAVSEEIKAALRELIAFFSPGKKRAMDVLEMKLCGSCERYKIVRRGME